MNGLWKDHKDKIVLGHISNNSKTYLPYNLRPDYIREMYSSKIISIHQDWAKYVSTEPG